MRRLHLRLKLRRGLPQVKVQRPSSREEREEKRKTGFNGRIFFPPVYLRITQHGTVERATVILYVTYARDVV